MSRLFENRVSTTPQERVESMCAKMQLGAELINSLSHGGDLSDEALKCLRIARLIIELIEARN